MRLQLNSVVQTGDVIFLIRIRRVKVSLNLLRVKVRALKHPLVEDGQGNLSGVMNLVLLLTSALISLLLWK